MGEETNLGLWLRKRRLERGLTQRELADLSDLSRRWLVEIEAGRAQPSLSAALRLIAALGADLSEVPGVPQARTRSGAVTRKLSSEEAEARRRELLLGSWALLVGPSVVDLERVACMATVATGPSFDAASVREAEAVTALLIAESYRTQPAGLL